jgi:hypothetical protein
MRALVAGALLFSGALAISCALAQSAEEFGSITRPATTTARPRAAAPELDRAAGSNGAGRVQEVSAPPGQPGALGGVSESSGYFICADYDQAGKRCRVRALSAEQRERALQTGVEVAQYGMRIQQEAILRAQQGGPGAATAGDAFSRCITNAMQAASVAGRPTQAQQARIFQKCAQ